MWRWDQGEPFGNDVPNNNPSGAGAFEFPLRFPGQYFDRETNLKYPATALTDATFAEIKKLGWSKCSGHPGNWDSYVDASKGKDREQTIFQNNSYWFKGTTLLTISMRYYAGVTKNTHRLKVPDNTQQQVVVLENTNPVVKEKLGITCPQGSTTK